MKFGLFFQKKLYFLKFSITIPDVVYVINGGKTKEKVSFDKSSIVFAFYSDPR